MAQQFVINDIYLRVNANDIEYHELRPVESMTGARDDAAVIAVSPFFMNSYYSVVLTFDLTNSVDSANLVRLATEIDHYPFLFIKSEKLASMLSGLNPDTGGYHIYGVQGYSFMQTALDQNTVVVEISLLYFNQVPLCRSWRWIKYHRDSVKFTGTKSFDGSQANQATRTDTLLREFMSTNPHGTRIVSDPVSHGDVGTYGSDVFSVRDDDVISPHMDYFKDEYIRRTNSLSSIDRSFFSVMYPEITEVPPPNKETVSLLRSAGRLESHKVSAPEIRDPEKFMNQPERPHPKEGDKVGDPQEKTVYVIWNTLSDEKGRPVSINTDGRTLEMIKIECHNNMVPRMMSGYDDPVLQYMGKGSSELTVVINSNTGLSADSQLDSSWTPSLINDSSSPAQRFMKLCSNKVRSNRSAFREYSALNVLKVDTFLTRLLPRTGFVLKQENVISSGWDSGDASQGRDRHLYQFTESYPISLLRRQRYEAERNKDSGFSMDEKLKIISECIDIRDRLERDRVQFENTKGDKSLFTRVVETVVKDGISSETWENIKVLNDNRVLFTTRHGSEFDTVIEDLRRSLLSIHSGYLERTAIDPDLGRARSLNMRHKNPSTIALMGMGYSDAQHAWGPQSNGEKDSIVRATDTAIERLIILRHGYNPIVSPVQRLLDRAMKDENVIVSDFKGQGYPDLMLEERLPLENYKDFGVYDVRKIQPFFFIRQKPYVSYKTLESMWSTASRITADDFASFDAPVGEESDPEYKVKRPDITEGDIFTTPYGEKIDLNGDTDRFTMTEKELANLLKNSYSQESGLMLPRNKEDKIDLGPPEDGEGVEIANLFDDTDLFHQSMQEMKIDIDDEDQQAAYQLRNISRFFERGMNTAFPTAKVFIVGGKESRLSFVEHDYYEVRGIVDLELITSSDDNPIDVLNMTLLNPNNVYSDPLVYNTLDPMKQRGLQIHPGTRLHVKIGYSNDINDLETVFNGVVTDVDQGDSYVLNIACEGFGRELVQVEHGDKPGDDTFWFSAKTHQIVSHMLYMPEIKHYGMLHYPDFIPKFRGRNWTTLQDVRNKRLGNFGATSAGWIKTELFLNINTDTIAKIDSSFGASLWGLVPGSGKPTFYMFSVFESTPHSVLKEMEYRHPAIVSKSLLYDTRMTYFMGTKEQLYIYRSFSKNFMSGFALSAGKRMSGGAVQSNSSIYDTLEFIRFKPSTNFHIASTNHNIIQNKLRVTSDFGTEVDIPYYNSQSDLKSGEFKYKRVKLDDNLDSVDTRLVHFGDDNSTYSMTGAHGDSAATRYGITYLRREIERMYDGSIVILGEPTMRAGDYVALFDDQRGMSGIVKVRECLHRYSAESGYTTIITPGLYAESGHLNAKRSHLFLKLFTVASMVMRGTKVQTSKILKSKDSAAYMSINANPASRRGSMSSPMSERPGLDILKIGGVETSQWIATFTEQAIIVGGIRYMLSSTGTWLAASLAEMSVATTSIRFAPAALTAGVSWLLGISSAAVASTVGIVLAVGVVIGVPLFVLFGMNKVEDKAMLRQPLKIYPLQENGLPYVGGIVGFLDNGFWESKVLNIVNTAEDAKLMLSTVKRVWFGE